MLKLCLVRKRVFLVVLLLVFSSSVWLGVSVLWCWVSVVVLSMCGWGMVK